MAYISTTITPPGGSLPIAATKLPSNQSINEKASLTMEANSTNPNQPNFDSQRFALLFLLSGVAIMAALVIFTSCRRMRSRSRSSIIRDVKPQGQSLPRPNSLNASRLEPLRINTRSPRIDTCLSHSSLMSPDHLKDDQLLTLSQPTHSGGLNGALGRSRNPKRTFSTLSETDYHLIQVGNDSSVDMILPEESASQVTGNRTIIMNPDV